MTEECKEITPTLPNEIWTDILQYLYSRELLQCANVCRSFYYIAKKLLYEVPNFKKRVKLSDINTFPIKILRTCQIEGSFRRIEGLKSLERVIVDTRQSENQFGYRVISKNENIDFYIAVKHLMRPVRYRNNKGYNRGNVYLMSTSDYLINFSQLNKLKEFQFQHLAISQIESHYSDTVTTNEILYFCQNIQINRIILDYCPIWAKINLELIYPIANKIVYICSTIFWRHNIFPIGICRQLKNLEVLDIRRGTIFARDDFNKLNYQNIIISDELHGIREENITVERVNQLLFQLDKEHVKTTHAFRIYFKKPGNKFASRLEKFFVHPGIGRGGEYVSFRSRKKWGGKE